MDEKFKVGDEVTLKSEFPVDEVYDWINRARAEKWVGRIVGVEPHTEGKEWRVLFSHASAYAIGITPDELELFIDPRDTQIETLQRENTRLREALKPFANTYRFDNLDLQDDTPNAPVYVYVYRTSDLLPGDRVLYQRDFKAGAKALQQEEK